jgi:hypothetical protein
MCMQKKLEATTKRCYLCRKRVPLGLWRTGQHR